MRTGTEQYYERRALEYDRVYDKPERQADIATLRGHIDAVLSGRRVLEVAAGTGYWTRSYADRAVAVVASDVNDRTLDVARARRAWPPHVSFRRADAFELALVPGRFDAAFAGFFWSHVPLGRIDDFLSGLVRRVEPGSIVLFADNNYVHGSNHPVTRTDIEGNTFQRRTLADGTAWDVLKNFPTPDELTGRLGRFGTEIQVRSLTYYWSATFRTPSDPARSTRDGGSA